MVHSSERKVRHRAEGSVRRAWSPRHNLLAALAALFALALILVTSSPGTYARWSDSLTLSPGSIDAGEMQVSILPGQQILWYQYAPNGAETITTYDGVSPLKPGESLVLKQPISIIAKGNNLKARLSIDTSAVATSGSPDLRDEVAPRVTTTVQANTGSTSLTPISGQTNAWTVGPQHDGDTYTISVKLTVRASTNGFSGGNAPASNWWGTRLQGEALNASNLSIVLEQIQ